MKKLLYSLVLILIGFVGAMFAETHIPGTEVSDCFETSDYKFKKDMWLKFKVGSDVDNKYYPLGSEFPNSYEILIERLIGNVKDSDCSDFVDGNAK